LRLTGRHSLTRRLTLLFMLASSAVLLALGLVIASSVEQHFEEQDMEVLSGKMALTRHTLAQLQSLNDLAHITHQMDNSLVGHHGLEVLVLSPQRTVMFATPNAGFATDLVVASARSENTRRCGRWAHKPTAALRPSCPPASSPARRGLWRWRPTSRTTRPSCAHSGRRCGSLWQARRLCPAGWVGSWRGAGWRRCAPCANRHRGSPRSS
jgi:hypothetical protein